MKTGRLYLALSEPLTGSFERLGASERQTRKLPRSSGSGMSLLTLGSVPAGSRDFAAD